MQTESMPETVMSQLNGYLDARTAWLVAKGGGSPSQPRGRRPAPAGLPDNEGGTQRSLMSWV